MKKQGKTNYADMLASLLPVLCLTGALIFSEGPASLLCALCAVLWHETGHIVFFLLTDTPLPRFSADKFGFRLSPAYALTAGKSSLICLGGPLFNLVAGILLYRLSGATGAFGLLGGMQLLYGLFNLLPVGTMDGGRLFRTLAERFCPGAADTLFRLAEGLSLGFLFFFSMFAFYFSACGLYGIFFSFFSFVKAAGNQFEKNEIFH